MKEQTLREFFDGAIDAKQLAADVAGSRKRLSDIAVAIEVEDMNGEFQVNREHALKLCAAVLDGDLSSDMLADIGFALQASDHFVWDADEDEVLCNVLNDWACPEINYPLDAEQMLLFRRWLRNEEPYPSKRPLNNKTPEQRLVAWREKHKSRESLAPSE